jgi:hypothetical protein
MIRHSLLASLKTLSQNQTLTLARSVSGTAKGKGKLKAAQVLKRASSKKKQASKEPSSSRGGRGDKEVIDRLTTMTSSCLSAPTPTRYLSAQGRAREAEREKLGLFSKERQRELDMIKAQKKAAKEGNKEEQRVLLGNYYISDILSIL